MFAAAFGIGTKNQKGEWLEVYFPRPMLSPNSMMIENIIKNTSYRQGNQSIELSQSATSALIRSLEDRNQTEVLEIFSASESTIVLTILEFDSTVQTPQEAYLKLQLLSCRMVLPNTINLENIFGCLPNVVWTNAGPIDPEEIEEAMMIARSEGKNLEISSVDKFPKMTNYVVPKGVRIAHSARVRLGAFLGEGTTVMHEGFVNFNAGTIGPNMVEGRISQGVTVESGTDLGGSASTAGTLSGGGNVVITIGKDCLISANAGTGIPLGDRCTIEAGLYITPGAIIQVLDENRVMIKQVKARELAGQSDMLFIRNSATGVIECRTNRSAIELNPVLHENN